MLTTTPSLQQLQRAISISEQIERLQSELSAVLGGQAQGRGNASVSQTSAPSQKGKRGGKRTFSAETRAKMAAAQRARWGNKEATTAAKAPASVASKTRKGKGGISPEGRARIAAATRARWAARKNGASVANTKAKTASLQGAVSSRPAADQKQKRTISPEARQRMVDAAKQRWAKRK